MLVEIFIVGMILYILLTLHKNDMAKGGEGVPVIGDILVDVEIYLKKVFEKSKSKKKKNRTSSKSSSLDDEQITQKTRSPAVMNNMEKFENVNPALNKPKSKHHHKHRSKFESTMKNMKIGDE